MWETVFKSRHAHAKSTWSHLYWTRDSLGWREQLPTPQREKGPILTFLTWVGSWALPSRVEYNIHLVALFKRLLINACFFLYKAEHQKLWVCLGDCGNKVTSMSDAFLHIFLAHINQAIIFENVTGKWSLREASCKIRRSVATEAILPNFIQGCHAL